MSESRPATQTHQSELRGCFWKVAAVVSVIVIIAVAMAVFEAVDLPPQLRKSVGRLLFFGVALSVAYVLFALSRRHGAEGADAVLAQDDRPPVLYLRCFAADDVSSQLVGVATEEEQLAAILGDLGPVVAIGRPGERLPELGAARLYVSDAQWKRKVAQLMDQAVLVVLRMGETEGFVWEVRRVLTRRSPESVLFLVPATPEAWATFERVVAPLLDEPLPPRRRRPGRIGTLEAFVSFEPDGRPRLLPARRSFWRTRVTRPLEAPLRLTLRPVFERLGVSWTPPAVNGLRVGVFGLLGVWILGMIALGVAAANGWVDL